MATTKLKIIPGFLLLTSSILFGCNAGIGSGKSLENSITPELKIQTDTKTKDLNTFIKNNPTSDIAKLAAATIGITSTYIGSDVGSEGNCTGVAIAKNIFLTAAHCVTQYDTTRAPYQAAYKNITQVILSNGSKVQTYSTTSIMSPIV